MQIEIKLYDINIYKRERNVMNFVCHFIRTFSAKLNNNIKLLQKEHLI